MYCIKIKQKRGPQISRRKLGIYWLFRCRPIRNPIASPASARMIAGPVTPNGSFPGRSLFCEGRRLRSGDLFPRRRLSSTSIRRRLRFLGEAKYSNLIPRRASASASSATSSAICPGTLFTGPPFDQVKTTSRAKSAISMPTNGSLLFQHLAPGLPPDVYWMSTRQTDFTLCSTGCSKRMDSMLGI